MSTSEAKPGRPGIAEAVRTVRKHAPYSDTQGPPLCDTRGPDDASYGCTGPARSVRPGMPGRV